MQQLEQNYLQVLCNQKIAVAIYLTNGVKLSGIINSFDEHIIVLQDTHKTTSQLLYKHSISTIVPQKPL